jgi:predicted nucleotidyltransferase
MSDSAVQDRAVLLQNKLTILKNAILKHVPDTVKIYLFGSHAYGEPDDDSDIDIYIVIPHTRKDKIALLTKIRGELWDTDIGPVDFLIETNSVFNDRKDRCKLENMVFRKGKVIYG